MRARVSNDHQAAVDRRLAQLRAELAGEGSCEVPDEPPLPLGDDPGADAAVVVPGPEAWWGGTTRVRGARADPAGSGDGSAGQLGPFGPPVAPTEPALPVPGRHAARRSGDPIAARLVELAVPETLRGRLALSPGGLATVALVVALGIGLTCWFLVRARPSAVPVPTTSPVGAVVPGDPLDADASSAPAVPPVDAVGGSDAPPTQVTVDVAGKVRRPGIAVLPAGARVIDALKAAGGARAGVDLSALNLARVLTDGEQILVGVPGAVPAPAPAAGATAPAPGQLVDLNTADASALEALPEVGPVTAQAIIAYRTEHGGFAAVDELLDVDGIGEATLDQIRPWVTV